MDYYEKVKELIKDLHKDYHTLLYDRYNDYINLHFQQKMNKFWIEQQLEDPEKIAQKYRLYAKLYSIIGQKKSKGAGQLIKEALHMDILSRSYYRAKRMGLVIKSIFLFITGILLCTLGILFIVGSTDNYKANRTIVYAISMVFITLGFFLIYQIIDLRHKLTDDLLHVALDGCDLKDFSKQKQVNK